MKCHVTGRSREHSKSSSNPSLGRRIKGKLCPVLSTEQAPRGLFPLNFKGKVNSRESKYQQFWFFFFHSGEAPNKQHIIILSPNYFHEQIKGTNYPQTTCQNEACGFAAIILRLIMTPGARGTRSDIAVSENIVSYLTQEECNRNTQI